MGTTAVTQVSLCAGVTAVANAVHYRYVGSNFPDEEPPSTAELFQIAVLAYRLAWQTRDVVESYAETSERRQLDVSGTT
ncbi:hypothetical protein [Streptomyces chartreusis]|uniref:Uncharacterized protein n=1 Tax=Streptomyces chartreusis TaxID=1969 RepID=A0A7I0Y8U5_STRCX|nr:hypothetical protein [Streptomyces chartreusis]QKZ15926.1 hypothetical protein HUT05_24910 [Streptomyces chartreusis]